MTWISNSFMIAGPEGISEVDGFTYSGLGLHKIGRYRWSVTHLESGHRVVEVLGSEKDAKKAAVTVADLTDWTFRSLDGWRNTDPDLPEKIAKLTFFDPCIVRAGGSSSHGADLARQIAEARE